MTVTVQIPPPNVPYLAQDGTVSRPWRNFFQAMADRVGGYSGAPVTAGNGIALSGQQVSVDPADTVNWTAKQTFVRAAFAPGASVTPTANGQIEFQFTDNVTITLKGKGSDGVVRSVALTIA